ncbi:hypothetical protein QTP88_008169 [Uroleucon formosanum]
MNVRQAKRPKEKVINGSNHVPSTVGNLKNTESQQINEKRLSDFFVSKLVVEINSQVAQFRELLVHIGTARDSPETREKIRKLRRGCVDTCKHTSQLLIPQMRG